MHEEAIAFGRAVLKHRHTLGFADITPWAVRVTSEVGRVLLVLPLRDIKNLSATGAQSAAAPGGSGPPEPHSYSDDAIASRNRLANSALR